MWARGFKDAGSAFADPTTKNLRIKSIRCGRCFGVSRCVRCCANRRASLRVLRRDECRS